MELEKYKGYRSSTLSGGNKRRLCTINALIGGPDLQFFDVNIKFNSAFRNHQQV